MRLAQIRKERGLTQREVAQAIGFRTSAVGNYETGIREPNASTLKKLAAVLKCTVDELLADDDDDQGRA